MLWMWKRFEVMYKIGLCGFRSAAAAVSFFARLTPRKVGLDLGRLTGDWQALVGQIGLGLKSKWKNRVMHRQIQCMAQSFWLSITVFPLLNHGRRILFLRPTLHILDCDLLVDQGMSLA
jgi:hypothetical protein